MNKYPSSWQVQRLGKVFPKVVVGYVGNVNDYYCSEEEGVPFYRTLNIRNGYFRHIDLKYVTHSFNDKNKKSQIKNNDILIARVGANLGMVCKVTGLNSVANIANAIIIKSSLIDDADIDFFTYFLLSPLGKKQIFAGAAGGAQGVFNTKLTQEIKVPVPSFPEQQKIAKILSTWDKAISTTERLIDNSTQQKKALMQQLLTGKKRLLDGLGQRFEGEWEEVSIGSTSKCFSGGTPSRTKDEYYNGSIPWITSGKLNDRFVDSVNEYITELGLQNSSAKIVKNGSILVAMYGATAGKVALNTLDSATVNQAVLALEPKEKFHNLFLFYLLEVEMLKALLLVQGGQPNLSATIIKAIKIKVPALLEQQKIATVLTNADKEIELLEQQLADLQQEKKALMQVLLTGKKRVVVDGEVA
ncbi:restriction endonuclease subunit S [Psychrobacter sp. Choline-02u-13]|uniref:restriction endonuclease subunit S n=1 Tax=unclassified Psychrobacter TaxID=196806 RepID=UPI000C79CEF3|nr:MULTISPECIES: restriction endonuclease subunit S [unclassified Psychrobacter]PKG63454.1 restriction endonuclease subunit S [Psychrobacter sp. Choline-02u-13]PKH53903.1 restriction endonuclease subunit S [Psychrobacter sp. Choline-02u-9]